MNKRIYLCLAHMSGQEQKYIKEAFDTNWVVPLGPNVNGFEEDLKRFVESGTDGDIMDWAKTQGKEVVALSAGTAAVHLSLIALGVQAGDEVICQSFTFCASCNPIKYLGAIPVLVDSEPDTWNMDPALLEQAIKDRIEKTGRKPKAIVVSIFMVCQPRLMKYWLSPKNTTFRLLKMRQKDLEADTKGAYVALLANMAYCRSMATK